MIQVSIPAEISIKDYPYNVEMDLAIPLPTWWQTLTIGAEVECRIKANNIVLKNKCG